MGSVRAPVITVMVTGSRSWTDVERIRAVLRVIDWSCVRDREQRFVRLIHGAANGADAIAAREAKRLGWDVVQYPVQPEDWRRFGRRAGPMRNRTMLRSTPTFVVAFWDGESHGTADAIEVARQMGIRVEVFR